MLRILNDVHIGVARVAGTTPQSAYLLRQSILEQFGLLLPKQGDLMLLGDLFDSYSVPMADLLATYQILDEWLSRGVGTLYNVAGNHDLSKTSTNLSSFQFLGKLLSRRENYVHIEGPRLTPYGYIIPHLPNQDLFDAEVDKAKEFSFDNIFVHCNIMNGFAAQSDHSLNLSMEQIAGLKADTIICAHEHQHRKVGKVLIPGNQIASSVSDCLGEDAKYMTEIAEDGKVSLVKVRDVRELFSELNWRETCNTNTPFIRILGTATASEAAEATAFVSRFRASSAAFVVSNAIRIETEDGSYSDFEEALDAAQQFDLMSCLSELLTPEEVEIVKGLKC